jgi:hypothetical protein
MNQPLTRQSIRAEGLQEKVSPEQSFCPESTPEQSAEFRLLSELIRVGYLGSVGEP